MPTNKIDTLKILFLKDLGIKDLKGIEDFKSLLLLSCRNNNITSIDISNNASLTALDVGLNPLTDLDVSRNTALRIF